MEVKNWFEYPGVSNQQGLKELGVNAVLELSESKGNNK